MDKLKPSYKTFVIGSGKGGVGKSTVTVNLAIALAKRGLSVGILDADFYGPSIPIMLGLRHLSPPLQTNLNQPEKITPFYKFGVKALSIGFFVEEARSVVWRGPLLHGTLLKMLTEVAWGDLDLMLIDLPPGTGDIPLSLAQLLPIQGALVVCTPQEVALVDAVKAINAFDQLEIPLTGIIENMAGFTAPETGQVYHIFGQGKGQELANRFNTSLLASIPLFPAIRQGGDEGRPIAFYAKEDPVAYHFHQLAEDFSKNCLEALPNPFL